MLIKMNINSFFLKLFDFGSKLKIYVYSVFELKIIFINYNNKCNFLPWRK